MYHPYIEICEGPLSDGSQDVLSLNCNNTGSEVITVKWIDLCWLQHFFSKKSIIPKKSCSFPKIQNIFTDSCVLGKEKFVSFTNRSA